jgi:hypothetical protein
MAGRFRSLVIVALWALTLAVLMVGGCCATSEGGFWQYAFGAGLPAVAALCTWVLADSRTTGTAATDADFWNRRQGAPRVRWKNPSK